MNSDNLACNETMVYMINFKCYEKIRLIFFVLDMFSKDINTTNLKHVSSYEEPDDQIGKMLFHIIGIERVDLQYVCDNAL